MPIGLGLLAVLILATPGVAGADSGGATVQPLPESSELEVAAELHHQCGEGEGCSWFGEAAAYSASAECPFAYDASRGVWVGEVQSSAGTVSAHFAFDPSRLERVVVVCLYVYAGGENTWVGQSHPFDRYTGREILPPPSSPPPPPAQPTHEPSLAGMRDCERQWPNGAFLDTTPDVSCRTARAVRAELFGRSYVSTKSTRCENRTYCVVRGFRCWGQWEGRLRPFSYAHHASCRSGRRRIVIDIG
jgi:hypothetical protein